MATEQVAWFKDEGEKGKEKRKERRKENKRTRLKTVILHAVKLD